MASKQFLFVSNTINRYEKVALRLPDLKFLKLSVAGNSYGTLQGFRPGSRAGIFAQTRVSCFENAKPGLFRVRFRLSQGKRKKVS